MSGIKQIVCLANSRKPGGRCVAGRELTPGGPGPWIRPVGPDTSHSLTLAQRRYENGTEAQLLDAVEMRLVSPEPLDYQKENWIIDPSYGWVKRGTVRREDLRAFLNSPPVLWINGHHGGGLNDRIPVSLTKFFRRSLSLIAVPRFRVGVVSGQTRSGSVRPRVLSRFEYGGVEYRLWVTDPVIEHEYGAKHEGEYDLGAAYLTISLGEPIGDSCYKLVAGVIGQ